MWTNETIGESTCQVWQPSTPPRFVLVWLGSDSPLSPPDFATVVWPSDTWHLTKPEEVHLVDVLLPWIAQRWGVTSRGIALAGTGPGGQAALRFGFKHPDRVGAIAALQPHIEFEQMHGEGTVLDELFPRKEAARQANAILALNSAKIPHLVWLSTNVDDVRWHRGADRLHEKLLAIGHQHTFLERESSVGEMLTAITQALQILSRRLM